MQIANETIEFKLTELHPKQQEISNSGATIKVVCAGRRSGKSKLCCSEGSLVALAERIPVWWVAPTFRNTKAAWRELTKLAQQLKGRTKIFKDEFLIEYPGGGFVQVVSAVDPDNMRGDNIGYYIFDEAAHGQERVDTDIITPALLDYAGITPSGGKSMLISTPNGFNWFHKRYMLGLAKERDHAAFHFTTWDNPYMVNTPEKLRALERMQATMTEKAYRQEIMAEFVADALSVFRNIQDCIAADPETEPIPGHDYVMGIDWGRKHDYTAISVWNATERREVALDRFSQVGFGIQHARIQALYDHWLPMAMLAEENAIGMANVERLQDYGLPVNGFKMTYESKKQVVEKFALATEKVEVGLLDDPLANGELQAFQEVVNVKTGRIKYDHPEGGYSDTVVARLLAYEQIGVALAAPFILEW